MRDSLKIPAILLIVLISTVVGGVFFVPPSNISALWPANALLFSAVYLLPDRKSLCLLLAWPAYVLAELWLGFPLLNSTIYGAANVVEVGALLWLLRRTKIQTLAFNSLRSLYLFIALALPASVCGGLIGAAGAALAGAPYGEVLLRWSLADFFGYSLCVPVLLAWASRRSEWPAWPRPIVAVESIGLMTAILGAAMIVYGPGIPGCPEGIAENQLLIVPLLLWAALRFGPVGGAVSIVVVACVAFFSATHGLGPFGRGTPEHNVAALQWFFLALVLSVMTVASLNAERRKSLDAISAERDRNRQMVVELSTAEDQLRRYKDHLEDDVQQRTADLVLARNAAEAANLAKSTFLSNMSHELRTPLNAILGFSGIVRRDPSLSDSARQNLDIIVRSGEHLLALINDVLEMAKIEAGRVQLEKVPFDLGAMVRDVADTMQLRAQDKGLSLVIDQDSRFPRYIVGDEARLRQVLINLLGNAVKFTPSGGVVMRLATRQDSYSHLLIEVEDTGPGISAEERLRIFEPFVQLGEHGINKGTGLGLTITRQFVQLMGGRISLESEPGKGALFRVDLPLTEARESEIAQELVSAHGDVVGVAPGQPAYRILVVEDQRDNQLLLASLMETIGLQVKVADNGEQAVRLFETWRPDLIWMDRRMPGMDGLEATRRIRELPGGNEVKIVAVTASALLEERHDELEAGADDFIRKPYRIDEIYDSLARQLGLRYVRDAANAPTEAAVLTPEMLLKLPASLREELEGALLSLEQERIDRAIRSIESGFPLLGKILAQLAEDYDYAPILRAMESKDVSAPPGG